uniref:Uncharacterized protein n=1 Tax=Oryza brachyantha TaxID=4533 RepID=J3LFG3_ORYBR
MTPRGKGDALIIKLDTYILAPQSKQSKERMKETRLILYYMVCFPNLATQNAGENDRGFWPVFLFAVVTCIACMNFLPSVEIYEVYMQEGSTWH